MHLRLRVQASGWSEAEPESREELIAMVEIAEIRAAVEFGKSDIQSVRGQAAEAKESFMISFARYKADTLSDPLRDSSSLKPIPPTHPHLSQHHLKHRER